MNDIVDVLAPPPKKVEWVKAEQIE